MHVLIVGCGIYGLSAGWALRRAGHRVTLVERSTLPNPLASSGDRHRLIRYAYGDAVGYMRMVQDAFAAWDRLWRDLGTRYYVETGTLALGQKGTSWCAQSLHALRQDGHPVEDLSRAALAERFPLLDPEGVEQAFYLPSGGALLADRIVSALARWLKDNDAELIEGADVVQVDGESARAVLADGRTLAADLLLVAAGPWIARLVPELAATVVPSRQVVAYLAPPEEIAAHWARHPMILDIGAGAGFYLVPPVIAPNGTSTGLKVGDHSFTRRGDPDRDRLAMAAEAQAVLDQCRVRLRGFDRYRLAEAKTCFYTVEAGEHFVARPIGRAGWALSCCSGHGFKFGPAIGEGIAALAGGAVPPENFVRWVAGDPAAPSPVQR